MYTPKFWGLSKPSFSARLLIPAAYIYSLVSSIQRTYVRPKKINIPVICIGNLTAGGAGKTPTAIAISKIIKQSGGHPHFLTRGYGGKEKGPLLVNRKEHSASNVGDEALLLARHAPTWIGRNRYTSAQAAVANGASILIMDDGFQNTSLKKDISLVVIDGGFGFGNECIIPAGPLREPIAQGLNRSNAILIIGTHKVNLNHSISAYNGLLLRAEMIPSMESYKLREKAVIAFAGIGRPQKFFDTLESIGCEIIDRIPFPDHHRYSADEIMNLVENASKSGAIPVTTEKDWIRLPNESKQMITPVAVNLEWENLTDIEHMISELLKEHIDLYGKT